MWSLPLSSIWSSARRVPWRPRPRRFGVVVGLNAPIDAPGLPAGLKLDMDPNEALTLADLIARAVSSARAGADLDDYYKEQPSQWTDIVVLARCSDTLDQLVDYYRQAYTEDRPATTGELAEHLVVQALMVAEGKTGPNSGTWVSWPLPRSNGSSGVSGDRHARCDWCTHPGTSQS